MLPETPILMALILVPFIAFCVIVGMYLSLRAKGVLGAVIPSVAIVVLIALVMGFCGFQIVNEVPLIGSIVNSFSPATSLIVIINPWEHVSGFATGEAGGRFMLFLAACFAAGGYSLAVYGILMSMVRNFDQTVRKLTGTG